jgi:hypothetical protein
MTSVIGWLPKSVGTTERAQSASSSSVGKGIVRVFRAIANAVVQIVAIFTPHIPARFIEYPEAQFASGAEYGEAQLASIAEFGVAAFATSVEYSEG